MGSFASPRRPITSGGLDGKTSSLEYKFDGSVGSERSRRNGPFGHQHSNRKSLSGLHNSANAEKSLASSYQSSPLFDRLTDPNTFSGVYRERFVCRDGRINGHWDDNKVVDISQRNYLRSKAGPTGYTHGTSSDSRDRAVKAPIFQTEALPRKPGETLELCSWNNAAPQKFGVQQVPARQIFVFRNGDYHDQGTMFTVNVKTPGCSGCKSTTYINYEQLKRDLSKIGLPTGPVRKLYDWTHGAWVKDLTDLQDGGVYIACAGEPVRRDRLPKVLMDLRNRSSK